jgi:hypothetical protein
VGQTNDQIRRKKKKKKKKKERKKERKERRNLILSLTINSYLFPLIMIKKREKYKISSCGLLDLQFTPCGIKTNSKVPVVCKKTI